MIICKNTGKVFNEYAVDKPMHILGAVMICPNCGERKIFSRHRKAHPPVKLNEGAVNLTR